MESEEGQRTIPFQLQFDKPIASQIKIAEWNPEKDLLAMVTDDSKILLHRFNWQRLWTISPGRCITSLCWRPDGKAIAVGLEDGSISLHDVENGKLLRSIKSHNEAVVCLSWVEDSQPGADECENSATYEDRTSRFFPPAPRIPWMPGLSSGDTGIMDESEDASQELSNSSHQRFNILCSGDKGGCICFSIFGIFSIGKINIHKFHIHTASLDKQNAYCLQNTSIHKIALSNNLCELIVLCSGEVIQERLEVKDNCKQESFIGLHSLLLSTSIFRKRKNELHQMAQQASNIEDLIEVVRASLPLMHKQWSDAMHTFHEKFDPLSPLISDHGMDSTPQEEFLSLLGGARTSPPIHQFLLSSLGEVGLKRLAKSVDSSSKELNVIIREHLQPAIEIIAFRIGELEGLSRWRARYKDIGLDENLVHAAAEKAGILLVQVERFLRVLAGVAYQFQNFFAWLTRCAKVLMTEPIDQLPLYNSELVVIFLKFLYEHDPVRQLLENSEVNQNIEVDLDTIQRLEELVRFGGFMDTEYLRRTLAKEFELMEHSFKEAFQLPFTTISKQIQCEDLLPLYPVPSLPISSVLHVPTSVSFYEDVPTDASTSHAPGHSLVDYSCFRLPHSSASDTSSSIGIVRGLIHDSGHITKGKTSLEAVLLCIPDGYQCVDLALYKENQVVLLLNEMAATSESPGKACLAIVQTNDLPFVSIHRPACQNIWTLTELQGSVVDLNAQYNKVRCLPHSVMSPLAISISRGVACVFASRKRALVYILEEDEDEDEVSDAD